MGAFSDSLKANSAKLLETINNKCYDRAFELFNMVISLTPSPEHPGPWAKGLLANQWYPNNGPDFSAEVGSATSDDGSESRQRLVTELLGTEFEGKDGVVTMANNLPYAYRAEKLGWPTPQWSGSIGPYAMVSMSIQYIAAKYK
jgi:hypothetical protein